MTTDIIKKRTLEEANLIVSTKKTLRQLAKELNIGKSTIHKDMQKRLKYIDYELYKKVEKVFLEHISTRHYIGGMSTKKKYQKD